MVEIEEEEDKAVEDEMSEFEEKSVVTLGEIINPIENDDATETNTHYQFF